LKSIYSARYPAKERDKWNRGLSSRARHTNMPQLQYTFMLQP